MYSSLQKIDIVATAPAGPLYILTDHREPAEIEAEPEISVLFALTRVLRARAYGAEQGGTAPEIRYTCMADAPAVLVEALAAVGATLETHGGGAPQPLAPVAITPAELADRAFRQLAHRVLARIGLHDPAAALHALEAETLVEPLDREDDEIGYWTRIAELSALLGEIARARDGGRWIDCDRADIPFGFELPDQSVLLPTNRAARFLLDGEGESMFLLLANLHDANATDQPRPVLPSLRARDEAERDGLLWRALLAPSDHDACLDVPVIAYGSDSEKTFALFMATRTEDRDELHAEALANLANQQVEVADLELGGLPFVVVDGSFFAADKLLDRAFMRTLHARLDSQLLAAAVPRRGLMFATAADDPRGLSILATIARKEAGTSRAISTAVLLLLDGEVSGRAMIERGDGDEPERPAKKPGFLRRLFGKS